MFVLNGCVVMISSSSLTFPLSASSRASCDSITASLTLSGWSQPAHFNCQNIPASDTLKIFDEVVKIFLRKQINDSYNRSLMSGFYMDVVR